MRGGLPEGEAKERAALLGDVAEVIFIGGGIEGRSQADVADHLLAVVEATDGAQHDDGGQRRQGADTWVGDEAWRIGVAQGRRRDRVVELADLRGESREQLEALIPAPGRVRGEREGMTRDRAGGLVLVGAPFFDTHRATILRLTAQHRLPAISTQRSFAEQGGLMAYQEYTLDTERRVAVFVDKILKGAKPADLPIEQPTKFELVINLKTAKALNLTIPPALLQRADQVIE